MTQLSLKVKCKVSPVLLLVNCSSGAESSLQNYPEGRHSTFSLSRLNRAALPVRNTPALRQYVVLWWLNHNLSSVKRAALPERPAAAATSSNRSQKAP